MVSKLCCRQKAKDSVASTVCFLLFFFPLLAMRIVDFGRGFSGDWNKAARGPRTHHLICATRSVLCLVCRAVLKRQKRQVSSASFLSACKRPYRYAPPTKSCRVLGSRLVDTMAMVSLMGCATASCRWGLIGGDTLFPSEKVHALDAKSGSSSAVAGGRCAEGPGHSWVRLGKEGPWENVNNKGPMGNGDCTVTS